MPDAGTAEQAARNSPVVSSGPAVSSDPQPAAGNDLLGTVAFTLASCAPGAAGLVGPDVVTVTDVTTSLLLAARDASMPTAAVAEFLSQMLHVDASSLAAMDVSQIRSAVYAAVRGASPLLYAAGISLAATTPGPGSSSSGTGGSPAPAPASGPASPSSGSPSATSQPGIDPATVLGGVNSLPTDAELEWIQDVLGDRRYQVLRQYFTQWGDSIEGLPKFSEIQARLVTAAALQDVAAGPDSVTSPLSVAGFVRIPSSAALGVAVHKSVQAQYIADHPGNLICVDSGVYNDGDVRTLGDLKAGASTGKVITDEELKLFALAFKQLGLSDNSPLRSDIADLDLRTLYEIKPLTRAAEGVIQLWAYQAYLNMGFQEVTPRLGQASSTFREGDWPPAPLVMLVSDDPVMPVYAYVFQFTGSPDLPGFMPLPGLLLYELYTYQGNDLANAVAILAASVMAVLAARARKIGLAGAPANEDVEVPEEQPGKQAARVREDLRMIALIILALLILGLLIYLAFELAVLIALIVAVIAALLAVLTAAFDVTGTDLSSGDRAALAASFLNAASRIAAVAGLNAPAPPGVAAD